MLEPYFIAECVALICSIFLLFSKTEKYLKWFVLYTSIVVLIEVAGMWLKELLKDNHVIYNGFILFDMLFFFWIFYKSFKERNVKKTIKILTIAGIVIYAVNVTVGQGLTHFNSYTVIFECIAVSALAFTYLFFLAQDTGGKQFYKLTMFWVSIGVLLFYLPESILFSAFAYLSYTKQDSTLFGHAFWVVTNICNVICYLCFSIGFLCKLKLAG